MKSSKLQKKIYKKLEKAHKILLKNESSVEISHNITQNLLILNGGLLNEMNKEKIYEIFSPYGNIKSIIMRLGKSYSFISFIDNISSSKAVDNLNGRVISSYNEDTKPELRFYLFYIIQVPIDEDNLLFSVMPPGLQIYEDYINEVTEKELIDCINWDEKTGGETLKHRRVKHFGARFDYSTNDIDRIGSQVDTIPLLCVDLLRRMLEEKIIYQIPDQLTINQYQPGQGIPSHVDSHSAFEDEIIVLSLQSQIVMEFARPNGNSIPVLLKGRSLAVLRGESRYLWSHGITPRHYDIIPDKTSGAGLTSYKRGVRTSFTFRKIKTSACICTYPKQCDSQNITNEASIINISEREAVKLENKHVHQVYEKIANHFSETRHSCWPRVVDFINSLPKYSLVFDCGCGNGKYLHLRKDELHMVGGDRSFKLCQICRSNDYEIFVTDILSLPFRDNYFDAVISIAVIHHLANQKRRFEALKELVRVIRPGGRCLVYVWAFEQRYDDVKSKYLRPNPGGEKAKNYRLLNNKSSRQINDVNDRSNDTADSRSSNSEFKSRKNSSDAPDNGAATASAEKRAENLSEERDEEISNNSDYENENDEQLETTGVAKLPTHLNRTEFSSQDVFVPWSNKRRPDGPVERTAERRFYHVYKAGELEGLCADLSDSAAIVDSYYDQGNWCVVLQKL